MIVNPFKQVEKQMKAKLEKFSQALYRTTRYTIAILLMLMFFIIMLEVIFRYIVSSPAFWTEELARYLMFYMVLLGSSVAIRNDGHPALLFILQGFSMSFQKRWKILVDALVFLVLIFIFKEGLIMAVDEMISSTPALRISFFWIYIALPLGSLLMMFELVMRYFFGMHDKKDRLEEN